MVMSMHIGDAHCRPVQILLAHLKTDFCATPTTGMSVCTQELGDPPRDLSCAMHSHTSHTCAHIIFLLWNSVEDAKLCAVIWLPLHYLNFRFVPLRFRMTFMVSQVQHLYMRPARNTNILSDALREHLAVFGGPF